MNFAKFLRRPVLQTASVVTVGTQSYESFLSYISFRKLIFVIFFVICVTHKKDITQVDGLTK